MSLEEPTVCDVSQEGGELKNDELKEDKGDNVIRGVSFVGLGMSLS